MKYTIGEMMRKEHIPRRTRQTPNDVEIFRAIEMHWKENTKETLQALQAIHVAMGIGAKGPLEIRRACAVVIIKQPYFGRLLKRDAEEWLRKFDPDLDTIRKTDGLG